METQIAQVVSGLENGRITRRKLIHRLSLTVGASALPALGAAQTASQPFKADRVQPCLRVPRSTLARRAGRARMTPSNPSELRDQAMVAMLIGCGLRRVELLALHFESIQQREEHWVIADLVGKGGHVRTVPIPAWVKSGRRHVAEGTVGWCAPLRLAPASTSWRRTT